MSYKMLLVLLDREHYNENSMHIAQLVQSPSTIDVKIYLTSSN